MWRKPTMFRSSSTSGQPSPRVQETCCVSVVIDVSFDSWLLDFVQHLFVVHILLWPLFRCLLSDVLRWFATCSQPVPIQTFNLIRKPPPPYMCLPVSFKERLLLHESFLLHMVKMCFFSIQISSIHERYSPSKRSHLSQDHSLKKIPPLWRVPWTLCLN